MGDNRNLRARHADLADLFDRPDAAHPHGSARMVGQVFNAGSMPTTTGHYFAMHPGRAGGVESERSAASIAVDATQTFYALILGAGTVAVGDLIVCKLINGRWVGMKRGGTPVGTVTIPGCPCTAIPTTLHLTSSNPASNSGIFQNATLAYGPTPSWASTLALGTNSFMSTATFTDTAVPTDQFYYALVCVSGFYALTRVYQTSIFGSPFRDIIRFTWQAGLPGNPCTPFGMTRQTLAGGTTSGMFAGGDTSCIVTVVP